MNKLLLLFFLLGTNQSLFGQDMSLWIGENLSEVFYKNDKWYYQSNNEFREILPIDSKYYFEPEMLDKKIEIKFEQLDVNIDTIKLHLKKSILLFIKPTVASESSFKFDSFEYAVVGAFRAIEAKYHINGNGVFRKSDYRNKTLIEEDIDESVLIKFEALWKGIDIKGMRETSGWRNNCDNKEHSFTFYDTNGKSYNYTAILMREQLKPLRDFVLKLEEEFSKK